MRSNQTFLHASSFLSMTFIRSKNQFYYVAKQVKVSGPIFALKRMNKISA